MDPEQDKTGHMGRVGVFLLISYYGEQLIEPITQILFTLVLLKQRDFSSENEKYLRSPKGGCCWISDDLICLCMDSNWKKVQIS